MNRADTVKPRDAASLILHRNNTRGLEVLLGKRPSGSSFMPDVYVFPGGGVEAADARVKPASPLRRDYTAKLAVANSDARARTLACTAIRETFEEVGLMVADSANPGSVQHPSWEAFRQAQQAPLLGALRYIGRAITPTTRPKRFHARFFACAVDSVSGLSEQALKGNGELLDLRWLTIAETQDLPLRSVTRFMLEQLATQQVAGDQWIGSAVYTHKNGKISITY
ncbi:MAG: NUDIX hydrolase [Gammaproteobacteria bacterium]|nr:NUDIX hydrolase [Gammaproteobacteria bacterium]